MIWFRFDLDLILGFDASKDKPSASYLKGDLPALETIVRISRSGNGRHGLFPQQLRHGLVHAEFDDSGPRVDHPVRRLYAAVRVLEA